MTKKEIEDYINTYRIYPEEYKGIRDEEILVKLENNYDLDLDNNLVTRLEGRIDDTGNFVIDKLYEFPFFEPEKKKPVETNFSNVIRSYNKIVKDLGYPPYKDSWNLRDMVASLDRILATYCKNGENFYLKKEDPKLYNKTINRLYWFIWKHKDNALKMKCTEKHNSIKYD